MVDPVIEIEHLYKEYRLGLIGYGTLREDLQSWWARVRGKEDPNSILFSDNQSKDGRVSDHILALNDINLTVERGERLGIIGPNGAGKTTLLKIMARIASPSKGTIRIKGKVASLLAVGTGMHGELTGRENIYLNGSILGLRKFEIDERFDEIVHFSGVEHFIDTPTKRYSSGMGVRLGFSVAAHLDPDVLIVDEVLAVGDVEFRKKALGKMKDVSEGEGRTILFVSHNMDAIRQLCEKAILLDSGEIRKDGLVQDVVGDYLAQTGMKTLSAETHLKVDPTKDFQIAGFGIINHQGESSYSLDRTKPFVIYVDYVVRKIFKDVYIKIVVKTFEYLNGVPDDTHVFSWSEKHYNRYLKNDKPLETKPGSYRAKINFPGYLLNSGKFTLLVNIESLLLSQAYDYDENRNISFELFDSGSSHTVRGGRSAGLLGIPLDWNIEKLASI